jgi:hypothetical protein
VEQLAEERPSLGDTVAVSIGRAMNRRRFVGNTLRVALVAGTTLASPVLTPRKAWATHTCGPGGQRRDYGCKCASTPTCPSGRCGTTGCSGIRRRCNHWRSANPYGQYCWCSHNCCYGGLIGYWQCCDCWNGGGTGCSTSKGQSACICKRRSNINYC